MALQGRRAVGAIGCAVMVGSGFGCASLLGVDDYKVSADSTAGGGGSAGASGSGTATGTGSGGAGGAVAGRPDAGGPVPCSGANPAGTRMCGAGKTCQTRVDCTYGCF